MGVTGGEFMAGAAGFVAGSPRDSHLPCQSHAHSRTGPEEPDPNIA
jgi:hypothetical protein